ncbi:hypothetical protein SAMN05443144_10583 [Fodinibius roseus]|uniref:Uncharacterized protein n=1 Tax=Fodinibius roseus TaxID=1194090 RepID=A0A1M4YJY3_9BACT|nr:hypothetical protein [Fodinibius roseus]SHF05973.1 hypothetical protein SAMN05443144_10583 [Fodinibius roseus]
MRRVYYKSIGLIPIALFEYPGIDMEYIFVYAERLALVGTLDTCKVDVILKHKQEIYQNGITTKRIGRYLTSGCEIINM